MDRKARFEPINRALPSLRAPSDGAGRRFRQQAAVIRECNSTLASLNFLEGVESSGVIDIDSIDCHPLGETIRRVLAHVIALQPPGNVEVGEAALTKLLAGKAASMYLSGEIAGQIPTGSLAAFSPKQVSRPSDASGAPLLSAICGPTASPYLNAPNQRMLRSSTEYAAAIEAFGVASTYLDPVLASSRKRYVQFVNDLLTADSVTAVCYIYAEAGVFFVTKKDGTLRLIIDARKGNQYFKKPPWVDMLSGEGMARVEVTLEQLADLCIASGDVKNAFHHFAIPLWLSRYFGLPPVRASDLNLTGKTIDGKLLASADLVYPVPRTLPMGFSWAMFFCQHVGLDLHRRAQLPRSLSWVADRAPPAIISDPEDGLLWNFADNFGNVCSTRPRANLMLGSVIDVAKQSGLLVHDIQWADGRGQNLGYDVRASSGSVSHTALRAVRTREAARALARRRTASGRAVQLTNGHLSFVGLLCRGSLSVLNTAFRFALAAYLEPQPIWETVRKELLAFAGLMPLIVADWTLPWSSTAYISDASPYGFAFAVADLGVAACSKMGRVRERSRFLMDDASAHARDHAFRSLGLDTDEDDIDGHRLAELTNVAGFPEISRHVLEPSQWTLVRHGAWRDKDETIIIYECRCLLYAVRHACFHLKPSRIVFILDNLGLVLALAKGRSSSFALLSVIRKVYASAFRSGHVLCFRWVPSEVNFADEGSRF